MDNSGKIIWARHNEVQTVNVKSLGADYELVDGERLPLAVKDLGACDLYPQVRSLGCAVCCLMPRRQWASCTAAGCVCTVAVPPGPCAVLSEPGALTLSGTSVCPVPLAVTLCCCSELEPQPQRPLCDCVW